MQSSMTNGLNWIQSSTILIIKNLVFVAVLRISV